MACVEHKSKGWPLLLQFNYMREIGARALARTLECNTCITTLDASVRSVGLKGLDVVDAVSGEDYRSEYMSASSTILEMAELVNYREG